MARKYELDRNFDIFFKILDGWTYIRCAQEYGMSVARCYQIFWDLIYRIDGIDGRSHTHLMQIRKNYVSVYMQAGLRLKKKMAAISHDTSA